LIERYVADERVRSIKFFTLKNSLESWKWRRI